MGKEVKIYSKERELLIKLIEEYKPQTDLEKGIKFSIGYKVKKAYNLIRLSDAQIAEEVEDRLEHFEHYNVNWYLEEEAFPTENFIFKPDKNHVQYSENYWTGMIHLSNDDGIHLSEAIKILKRENPKKYKELIEKISKSFSI